MTTAVDTSVIVAAFATWHDRHADGRAAVSSAAVLPAHAAVEATSVLSRLPPPHRSPVGTVVAFLAHHFPVGPRALTGPAHLELLRSAAVAGIAGGALYDALVGWTTAAEHATLVSFDRRAAPTYRALGIAVDLS